MSKLGIFTFNTEYTIAIDDLAREVENTGCESLWVPEHTHIPASRQTAFPGNKELPREYAHMADPFVSLAAAAAVTDHIKLGTGICLVNEHDVIALAKQVATLDRISNGRFLFGVGAGWNVEEMANHGIAFEERWAQLRERVEAMKALWTQEEASYHGKYVSFDQVWFYPKPISQPHPPIILGTFASEIGRQRVADYGDGWIPVTSFFRDVSAAVRDMRIRAHAAGRAGDITVSTFFIAPQPPEHKLAEALECEPERIIISIPALPRDEALAALEDAVARFERATRGGGT